jgi:hypothetical protein
MGFPSTGNPVTEFLINGTWTDLSSRVRAEDGQPGIRISRGRSDEQSRVAAQRCELTLNNRDGLLSNRNPSSIYYGLLPRNTQLRVKAGTGDTYLRLPHDYSATLTARASTPDVASLDIVGDLEVRADIQPLSWRPTLYPLIAGKYKITGDQRSWLLYLTPEGKPIFAWTTSGAVATRQTRTCTAAVPITAGRLSIKVTLDVNNGAAGHDVAFYTASSIDGTYTQLGTTITTAGVTSIFSSSAVLTAGQADDDATVFTNGMAFQGRFHKLRVYNGIAGTIVANPDFTAQSFGATSFADSTPKTWTVGAGARITSDRCRFWGELSSLPQRWDKSGRDVWITGTASGVIRRLTQGASPVRSAIYRALSQRSTLTGYWPLEDGSLALSAASAVADSAAGTSITLTPAETSTLPGAESATGMGATTSRFIGTPKTSSTTGTAYYTMYFKLTALPVADSTFATLTTTGTARKVNFKVGAAGFVFEFLAADGTTLDSQAVAFGSFSGVSYSPLNQWLAMNIILETSGGNVSYSARWSNVAAESFVGIGPTTFAGTVGRITQVLISTANSANFVDAQLAHVHTSTTDEDFVTTELAQAADAYLGETAGARMVRLSSEVGVTLEVVGDPDDTETMGYQTVSPYMDLMYDCADADQGILAEGRDFLGLEYHTRTALEHRRDIDIDYDAKHLAEVPVPTEDDQGVVNDVTVRRPNASSGRREIDSGAMSTLDPPSGIGRYDTDLTLNVELDSRLDDIASWIANRGSVDEARYPNLAVAAHRTIIAADATLLGQLAMLDVGMTAALVDLPAWLPPDDVLLLVQGYAEELGKFLWTITFNTTPATIYNTGRYDYTTVAGTSRYDHATSTLAAGVTSSATSLSVAANSSTPTTVDLWTTDVTSVPFDIMVGGEQITVTAISGASSPQTMTVTRAVNGISKAQIAGTRVRLYRPVYWGL